MKSMLLGLLLFLGACFSATPYRPGWQSTEAELSFVFDREGFRGISGWVWQLGTLCYTFDRYTGWKFRGWSEETDMFEVWAYLLGGSNSPPPKNPYHSGR